MPEPSSDLLAVARALMTFGPGPDHSGAFIRRAVSTAYYALFHKVSYAAAGHFMGRIEKTAQGM